MRKLSVDTKTRCNIINKKDNGNIKERYYIDSKIERKYCVSLSDKILIISVSYTVFMQFA